MGFNQIETKMTARQAALAKIHIAKTQLGMQDADYRAMLQRVANVDSAGKLDRAGQDRVLDELVRLGFKPTASTKKGKRPNPPASKEALISKVEAQLAEAGKSWAYADGIGKRMYGVEKCDWLTVSQLQGVIAALYKAALKQGRPVK